MPGPAAFRHCPEPERLDGTHDCPAVVRQLPLNDRNGPVPDLPERLAHHRHQGKVRGLPHVIAARAGTKVLYTPSGRPIDPGGIVRTNGGMRSHQLMRMSSLVEVQRS